MLTRIAAAVLAVASCLGQDEPQACRVSDYGCYPADPRANGMCAHACGQGPQAAHCQDYARADYTFCETHPGVLRSGGRGRCTLDGLPTWISRCKAGPVPVLPEGLRSQLP